MRRCHIHSVVFSLRLFETCIGCNWIFSGGVDICTHICFVLCCFLGRIRCSSRLHTDSCIVLRLFCGLCLYCAWLVVRSSRFHIGTGFSIFWSGLCLHWSSLVRSNRASLWIHSLLFMSRFRCSRFVVHSFSLHICSCRCIRLRLLLRWLGICSSCICCSRLLIGSTIVLLDILRRRRILDRNSIAYWKITTLFLLLSSGVIGGFRSRRLIY